MAKEPAKRKKNRHILVENGAAFFVLMLFIVLTTMFLVYFLIAIQMLNDEGIMLYAKQVSLDRELSQFKAFSGVEDIWMEEKDNYPLDLDSTYVLDEMFELSDKYGLPDPYYITPEILQSMTNEDRERFAQLSYCWIYYLMGSYDGVQENSDIKGPVYIYRDGDAYSVLINGDNDPTISVGTPILGLTGRPLDPARYLVGDLDLVENDLYNRLMAFKDDRGITCYGMATAIRESDAKGYLLTYVEEEAVTGRPKRNVNSLMSVIIIIMALAAAVYMILFYFITVRPLIRVKEGLQRFTDSKNINRLLEDMRSIKLLNEIGRLSDDISDMAVMLSDYQKVVQEQAKAATELSLAKEIQLAMLPAEFPDTKEEERFDIYASMKPARDVGGDLYDFFFADDDHLVLEVGDVSGKGVPAALFMMMAKTMVKDRFSLGKAPGELMKEINEALLANNKAALFITIGFLVVELSTGRVVEVNAGHMDPVLMRSGGEYKMQKYPHSMVVGIMEDMEYVEREWTLEPGDKLFIYSDGVTEAENINGKQLGNDRLVRILNEVRDRSQKEILEYVDSKVSEFADGADQSDDITMLGFTYYGTN
jgi:serine phosphatase RsbU (regulator of sigma subunit)